MTNRQIQNAYNWALKVLDYSLDENIELLGTEKAKTKAKRYLKLVHSHEKKKEVKFGEDYLSDLLCTIKYAEL